MIPETPTDLIKEIFESPLETPTDLEQAYRAYDYGVYKNNEATSNLDLIRSITDRTRNPEFLSGEASLTRRLILENVADLSTWALDTRCVDILKAVKTDGTKEYDQLQIEGLDKDVRNDIRKNDVERFFMQQLVSGIGCVSCGLSDTFYVPCSRDVTLDYMNHRYVYMERELEPDILNLVVAFWEHDYGDDYEPTYFDEVRKVIHGQIEKDGVFYEFIKIDDNCYYQAREYSVIHTMVFATHPDSFMPQGVFALVISEEYRTLELQVAIETRINKAMNASLIVANNALPREEAQKLYGDSVITLETDEASDASNLAGLFSYPPSRVEEIQGYRDELSRIEKNARAITGFYERPTEIQVGNTSATEASLAYENATARQRSIITEFTGVFAKCYTEICQRDYEVKVEYSASFNPLDEYLQKLALNELIPMFITQIKDDPTGKMFGGAITEKTVADAIMMKMRMGKLPISLINPPNPTRLTDEALNKEAQDKERAADQRLADAENTKAEAEIMKAKVADRESITNLMKVKLAAKKHDDDVRHKMLTVALDAKKLNDEVTAKKAKMILDSNIAASKVAVKTPIPQEGDE
ncbi:MAG: hypothetical protein ACR2N8_03025 [Parvibaculales bacterium]